MPPDRQYMIELDGTGGSTAAEPARWTYPMWPGTPTVIVTRMATDPSTYVGEVTFGREVLMTGPGEDSPEQARTAVLELFLTRVAAVLGGDREGSRLFLD